MGQRSALGSGWARIARLVRAGAAAYSLPAFAVRAHVARMKHEKFSSTYTADHTSNRSSEIAPPLLHYL